MNSAAANKIFPKRCAQAKELQPKPWHKSNRLKLPFAMSFSYKFGRDNRLPELIARRRQHQQTLRKKNNIPYSYKLTAMISSLILVTGNSLKKTDLTISLSNAKQIIIGSAPQFGWVLHVAANTVIDLGKAIQAFAKITGVALVTTLAIQNPA